jgi:hypothetical protein
MLMKLLITKYILHVSITTKKDKIIFKLYFRYNHNVINSFLSAVIIILATIQTLQNRESLQAWPVDVCTQIMQSQLIQSSCFNLTVKTIMVA